jgi:hypothetical protein
MATGKPTPVEISTAEHLAIMVETAILRHAKEQNITIYEECCDNLRKAPAPTGATSLHISMAACSFAAEALAAHEQQSAETAEPTAEWEAQKAERKTN